MKAHAIECTVQRSEICAVHHLCDANYTGVMELIQADWTDFKEAVAEIELQQRRLARWRASSVVTFLLGWALCWMMLGS